MFKFWIFYILLLIAAIGQNEFDKPKEYQDLEKCLDFIERLYTNSNDFFQNPKRNKNNLIKDLFKYGLFILQEIYHCQSLKSNDREIITFLTKINKCIDDDSDFSSVTYDTLRNPIAAFANFITLTNKCIINQKIKVYNRIPYLGECGDGLKFMQTLLTNLFSSTTVTYESLEQFQRYTLAVRYICNQKQMNLPPEILEILANIDRQYDNPQFLGQLRYFLNLLIIGYDGNTKIYPDGIRLNDITMISKQIIKFLEFTETILITVQSDAKNNNLGWLLNSVKTLYVNFHKFASIGIIE